MKKIVAWILMLTLVCGVMAISASAETADSQQTPPTESAQPNDGNRGNGRGGQKDGPNGRQPGRQRPGDQQPGNQQPDGQQPAEQQPDGQQSAEAQTGKQQFGRQRPNGKQNGRQNMQKPGNSVDFEAMLKDGVITQEVYDAIQKYLKENTPKAPAQQESVDGKTTATPKPAEQQQTAPAGDAAGDGMLQDLLTSGTITQEVYDAIAATQNQTKFNKN